MKARVLTALAGIPLAALVVHMGGWLFFAVALALALMCLHELKAALERASESQALAISLRLLWWPCAVSLALILLVAQWQAIPRLEIIVGIGGLRRSVPSSFILGGAIVIALWSWSIASFGDGGAKGARLLSLSVSLAALAHLSLWSFAILLRGRGEAWMWLALIGVWSSDIAAFFAGRAFGKRKMSPLSPGKSWEGFAGGMLACVAASTYLGAWTAIGPIAGATCGLAVGILAPLGDLAESLWKRELGAKDLGTILPGHGGIFDRCDSLIFALAGVYALSWIW